MLSQVRRAIFTPELSTSFVIVSAEPSRNIPALTGLRAVAAGLVFFGHMIMPHASSLPAVLHYGWTGVDIFFALSGYLFTYLYADALLEHRFSWAVYLKRRLIRIYPVTTLVVIIATFSRIQSVSLPNVLLHLTLLHGWFPEYRLRLNAPMWTLSIEESYYLVAPILILVLAFLEREMMQRILMKRNYVWRVVTLSSIALFLWFASVGLCRGWGSIYQDIVYYFSGIWDEHGQIYVIFGRLNDFVAGMLCAVLWRNIKPRRNYFGDLIVLVGFALYVLLCIFIDAQGGQELAGNHKLGSIALRSFAPAAAIIMLGLHTGGILSRILASRIMVILGECSFALYLIQFIPLGVSTNIGHDIQSLLESQGIHFAFAALMSYTIMNLVALGIHQFFERPISRYLRARYLSS